MANVIEVHFQHPCPLLTNQYTNPFSFPTPFFLRSFSLIGCTCGREWSADAHVQTPSSQLRENEACRGSHAETRLGFSKAAGATPKHTKRSESEGVWTSTDEGYKGEEVGSRRGSEGVEGRQAKRKENEWPNKAGEGGS